MTKNIQEKDELESLLSPEQAEYPKQAAQETLTYISHELSAIKSVKNSTLYDTLLSTDLTNRIKKVIDNNFLTPGFYSEGTVNRDAFLQRTLYLEKVLKGLNEMKTIYESNLPLNEIFKELLNNQIRHVQKYLMMTDNL